MKILTFVIPAYNSESFLHKCLDSMLVPELLEKLEILVVSDGSTDRTAEIAEGYCVRYPDTVRLISQENKGHGGALNTGCAAAMWCCPTTAPLISAPARSKTGGASRKHSKRPTLLGKSCPIGGVLTGI